MALFSGNICPRHYLVTLAVWQALEGNHRNKQFQFVVAGAAIGVAVWLRNETVLAAPALIGAVLLTQRVQALRTACWISIGTAAGMLPLLIYNQITFGLVTGPHVLVAGAAQYQRANDPLTMRLAWSDQLIVPHDEPLLVGAVIAMALIALITAVRRTSRVTNTGLALIIVLAIMISRLHQGLMVYYFHTN